jgi:hypothetical protein
VDVPRDTDNFPHHENRDQADPVRRRRQHRTGQRPDRRKSHSSPGFRHIDNHRHGNRSGIRNAARSRPQRRRHLRGWGVGLTVDEFALWLHLEDVYWTNEGRKSVDAVFCVLAVTGALIGGADFLSGRVGTTTWWSSVSLIAVNLLLCVICLLKGKLTTGVIGIVIGVVALIGAIRLAKPGSWWATHRYASRPLRAARAANRYGRRYEERWNRLRDLVAGAPSEERPS